MDTFFQPVAFEGQMVTWLNTICLKVTWLNDISHFAYFFKLSVSGIGHLA